MKQRKPKKGDWVTIQTDSFPTKVVFGRHYKVFKVHHLPSYLSYYYVGSKVYNGQKGFPLYGHEISLKKKK